MDFFAAVVILILVIFFPIKITVTHKFDDIEIRDPKGNKWFIWPSIDEDDE